MIAPKISKSFARFIAIRALMALLLFMTLAAWSMGSAVGSSPDEDYVLTSIWCGTEGNPPYCRKDPDRANAMILPIMAAEPQLCYMPGNGTESAHCQKYLFNQEISTDNYNSQERYPKGYFDFARKFVGSDIEKSVLGIRFFNSLLASVIIVFGSSLSRRNKDDFVIAFMSVATPTSLYFLSSVNTISWTLIGVSAFVFSFFAAIENLANIGRSLIPIALLILAIFLTVSSRSEGKFALTVLSFAMVLPVLVKKIVRKNKTIIAFTAVSLFYFVFTNSNYSLLDLFNKSNSAVIDGVFYSPLNLFIQNLIDLPKFLTGFFGAWGLGWFELKIGDLSWLLAMQSCLMILGYSFLNSIKVNRIVFCCLTGTLLLSILIANQSNFSQIGNDIQPRYFLPFLIGIVLITVGAKTVTFPLSLSVFVATMSVISNSVALRWTLRRYITGQDIFVAKSLNNRVEWWWGFDLNPERVWILGSSSLIMLFAVIIYEKRHSPDLNLRAQVNV